MGSVITLIIKYLPYLVDAAKSTPQLITLIAELRRIFSRTKPWTPEVAAAFDASLDDEIRNDPAWQIRD
jgi:hypothetical protein